MDSHIDEAVRGVLFRIHDARQHRRKTQAQVAVGIELPRPSYTLIEAGDQRLTVVTLFRIAKYLCVPVDWLLTGFMTTSAGRKQFQRCWMMPELGAMPATAPARPAALVSVEGPSVFAEASPATSSPARPSPATSSPARPSPATSSPARPSPATSSKRPAKGKGPKQPPAKAARRWGKIRKGEK